MPHREALDDAGSVSALAQRAAAGVQPVEQSGPGYHVRRGDGQGSGAAPVPVRVGASREWAWQPSRQVPPPGRGGVAAGPRGTGRARRPPAPGTPDARGAQEPDRAHGGAWLTGRRRARARCALRARLRQADRAPAGPEGGPLRALARWRRAGGLVGPRRRAGTIVRSRVGVRDGTVVRSRACTVARLRAGVVARAVARSHAAHGRADARRQRSSRRARGRARGRGGVAAGRARRAARPLRIGPVYGYSSPLSRRITNSARRSRKSVTIAANASGRSA